MHFLAKKMQKYLRMSKKSSTFARFFARVCAGTRIETLFINVRLGSG